MRNDVKNELKSDKKVLAFQIRLSRKEYNIVSKYAEEFEKSKNDIVRDAIRLFGFIKELENQGFKIVAVNPKTNESKELVFVI